MKKTLLILPLILLLTACYNYRELNSLAIVTAVSISKENNTYNVVAQIVNPKKATDASTSNEPDFITFKSTGKSLQIAFRKIVKESPKKIYGTQMQILLIDEDIAKEGLKESLDFFARDPEIRNEFKVLITKDKDILEVLTPLNKISSQNILDSLDISNKYLGYNNIITFNDLLSNTENNNIELVIPSIEKTNDNKEEDKEENLETSSSQTDVKLSKLGIFKNNQLLGYLDDEDSQMYNFITNNIKTTLIKTSYNKNEYIVNEIINSKTKLEANPKKRKVTITIKGKSEIAESTVKFNLTKEENIKRIEKDLNRKIENEIKDSIKKTTKLYNSDIYGFKDLFYKSNPKEFNKIRNNWYSDIYKNLNIEVKSNIKITEQGNLLGGINYDKQ